ncbi:MAG: AMP-binding protein, partial [Actinomycetota bacterium]
MSTPLTTGSGWATAETTRGVTATQQAMWFDARHDPDSVHLHVSFAVRLDAPVDPGHADTVIHHAIDEFDDLRSVFVDVDGRPERRILAARDVPAWRCDEISADDLDDALRELHGAPFDVENGPLVRFQGYLLPDGSMVVAIAAHHLVVDLWTIGLLGAWLGQAYAAVRRGEPMPPLRRLGSFDRHVEIESMRLSGSDRAAAVEHWSTLVDHSRPTTLVDDGLVVGPQRGLGDVVPVGLDREVEVGIRDLADRLGTSVRSVVLAALNAVLHRTLRADRVTVVESKANRSGATARTLGCCLNQVLRVSEAESSTTLAQLIAEVDRQSRASRPHDWLPLSILMHETGRPAGSAPPTEVAFSWQKSVRLVDPSLARSLALGDRSLDRDRELVAAASMPVRSSPAAVTLIGAAGDGGSLTLALEYQVERFARPSIERLGERLAHMLRATITDPDVLLDDVDLIGPEQRARQHREIDALDPTGETFTVSDLVDERIAASPDSVAIRHRGREVTYAELGRRTDRIAEVLAGVDGDDPIGVLTDRSVDMVAAVLAVWRTGRGFVPLDPSYPAARLGDMIGDAGVSCVVVDAATVGAVELVDVFERPNLTVVDLDDIPDDRPAATDGLERPERPVSSARPDGLAHVYFTSGSTGRPKGVAVTQASLAGFLRSMCERIDLDENDVVAASTTLSFDPALLELVGTLVVGGEVLLIDRDTVVDPVLFGSALGGATLVQATPTVYRMLIENGWTGHDRLAILCGGEPMTPRLAADLS